MKKSSGDSVKQVSISSFQDGGVRSNRDSPHQIRFLNSNTDHRTRELYRTFINDFHRYKNWKDYPGRRIGWIIYYNGDLAGSIGIASSPMSLGARDKWIGWDRKQKMRNLTKIATNYRFCLAIEGIGSMVLSTLHKIARKAWKEKYGDNLVLLDTMVKPPWTGTVYKASGWTKVGMTKGNSMKRPPSKSLTLRALDGSEGESHRKRAELLQLKGNKAASKEMPYFNFEVTKTVPKIIFVKPLHRYWKRELMK